MPEPISNRLRHHEDWRALSTINAYRCLIAAALVGTRFSPLLQPLVDINDATLFAAVSLLYLLCSGIAVITRMLHRPQPRTQVAVFCSLDIGFIASLCFAASGVSSGLGVLLIVPVAFSSALLNVRDTALVAALAAVAVLFQEAMRPLVFPAVEAMLFTACILCGLFFAVAGLGQWLAHRIRISQAIVAEHSGALRNMAALNRRIIEQMEVGAVALDGDHHIQLANSAAVQMLNLTAAPDPGTPLNQVSPVLTDALWAWLNTPGGTIGAIEPHGRRLLPAFSVLPAVAGRAQGTVPILIFLEDIERQSEQAQQLKLAALGRLSAGIAHEIRNPLSAISHAAQLLAESASLADDDRKLLDIMHRHNQRIDRIVDDVMGLSRHDNTTLSWLQLKPWLEDTMAEYRQHRDRPAELSLQHIDDTQSVRFNPPHLRRVLFNLWHNAEHHARRPDAALHVTLTGHQDENGVFCLDIVDDGPGIDAVAIKRILEPFYTTGKDGIGLGLHVARELCDANHAQLTAIAGSPGACFRITFASPSGSLHD